MGRRLVLIHSSSSDDDDETTQRLDASLISTMASATNPQSHRKASAKQSEATAAFQIPSELQDLEREPYHLDRYPADFRLNDAAESFDALLRTVEEGNREERLVRFLLNGIKGNSKGTADGLSIDEESVVSGKVTTSDPDDDDDDSRTAEDGGDDDEERGSATNILSLIPRERFQALYTLVRYVHQHHYACFCQESVSLQNLVATLRL
jgi:hypothetical protein